MTTAISVQDALDKLELGAPDLIISETTFPDGDGFELPRRVRATPDWADLPFIFLTAEGSIENKIRGLELGVDDYLTKPIYIKEIVTRINILLQKRQRTRFEERKDGHTRFAGRVADMPVVDVIQTIEISRKSGVIQFTGERGRQATIYFRDGRVIDADAGSLQGEDAIYRLLTWSDGEFEVVFRTVRRREVITTSSQGLLMEGMRRLDEWSRLLEQLPPLTHRFEVDAAELAARLGDIPDDNNNILRLIDGKRTLTEVIDSSDVGDLECLQAISRLYFEELLTDLDHGKAVRRDTGRLTPLVAVDSPSPIEDAVSGPIPLRALIEASEADVLSEEPAEEHAILESPPLPGALLGGYRPSSLRLIDEAVAAAQAIEPSLFDDVPTSPGKPTVETLAAIAAGASQPVVTSSDSYDHEEPTSVGNVVMTKGSNGISVEPIPVLDADEEDSIPHAIPHDEPSQPSHRRSVSPQPQPQPQAAASASRDESGLRMIGSLGRDRAEASGELAPVGTPPRALNETQRELVTILPRRITREVPLLPADTLAQAESVVVPAPRVPRTKPPTAPPPIPAAARTKPITKPPPLPVRPVDPPRELDEATREGSGVFRRRTGPGAGPIALFVVAMILSAVAVVVWLRKSPDKRDKIAVTLDAAAAGPSIEPIPVDAGLATTDAGVVPGADAAVRPDASVAPVDAGVDRGKLARERMAKAQAALQEADFEGALVHIDESLALRKTARAYLVRAQALHRLNRIDEALDAVDRAAEAAPTYAAVFDTRGRILWTAGRKDEARFAFEEFLAIEGDTPRAQSIRELIREPQ